MQDLRVHPQTGDALLLGTDDRKPGTNIDASCFRHRALKISIESRFEMHIESTRLQYVRIEDANIELHFMPVKPFTENGYKSADRNWGSELPAVS